MKAIKYITSALLIMLSTIALANIDQPKFPELENNDQYMALKREYNRLVEQEDSIQLLVADARNKFSTSRDSIQNIELLDSFSSHILSLEEQIYEIRLLRGNIIDELTNIEQEYILTHMYSSNTEDDYYANDYTNRQDSLANGHRMIINNELIIKSLSKDDYTDLEQAYLKDMSMAELTHEYLDTYRLLRSTVSAYNETNNESEADSLYSRYQFLAESADSLNSEIDNRWNYILDTKYYAYSYILENKNRYNLLDSSSTDFTTMQQQCAQEDGNYASDALMHYAVGRPTLIAFERDFANDMGLRNAADSLSNLYNSIESPDYQLEPISVTRRLFIDYLPIIIGRTNFYNTSNPVPDVKVYSRGTIYRISLGTFRNKQPMTLFKGVQPLYIDKTEDGYTYYAGGFATRKEADEAQIFLKEKGFKNPEICRWRDGEMANLSTTNNNSNEDNGNVVPTGNRYIVILSCEQISEDMQNTITTTAPEKRIFRRGAEFAVGTFTERAEADLLLSTLMDKYPDVSASIVELDL